MSEQPKCQQILSTGFVPYWALQDDRRCGKNAHWKIENFMLHGPNKTQTLCTRHAKARGIHLCTRLTPPLTPSQNT